MNNNNNPLNLKTQTEHKKIRNPFNNIKPFYSLPQRFIKNSTKIIVQNQIIL